MLPPAVMGWGSGGRGGTYQRQSSMTDMRARPHSPATTHRLALLSSTITTTYRSLYLVILSLMLGSSGCCRRTRTVFSENVYGVKFGGDENLWLQMWSFILSLLFFFLFVKYLQTEFGFRCIMLLLFPNVRCTSERVLIIVTLYKCLYKVNKLELITINENKNKMISVSRV